MKRKHHGSLTSSPELAHAVRRLKKGDASGLDVIVRLTQDRLYRFCFYLTGKEEKARELCQDTYLKALKPMESLPDPKGILPWLFKVARNAHIDQIRLVETRVEESQSHETDENPILSALSDPSAFDPDERLGVKEALGRLKEEHRSVLLMVDFEEYSYAEASQLLEINEESLKSRLRRAREAFLKLLKEGDPK